MTIKTFNQGIHPPYEKDRTANSSITTAPLPERVILPLQQHIGAPNVSLVKKGDNVKKGQVIASSEAFVSAPVHASISGKVVDVGPTMNPLGYEVTSITIESDGLDEPIEGLSSKGDVETLSAEELKKLIRDAGIVGMGGAMFPTHVKVSVPQDKTIDSMIVNGAECEPYLTIDYRLMLERTSHILYGLRGLMKILGVKRGYIGIENNKPEAIKTMKKALHGQGDIQVVVLDTKYPQGGEKMLIKAILDREVPQGGLPLDVGVVVNNVSTVVAIAEAVIEGMPLITRGATITGSSIERPMNVYYRIGTLIKDLIQLAGGLKEDAGKIILGGPMMGFSQPHLEIPTVKGTSGILVLSKAQSLPLEIGPCIRCARCIDVCPTYLLPTDLARLSEHQVLKGLKEYNVLDCIECGSCSYTCPSKIPLLEWIRLGKAQVMAYDKSHAT